MNGPKLTAGWPALLIGMLLAPISFAQDAEERITIAGSDKRLTRAEINNVYGPADWFPGRYGTMPEMVQYGDREKGIWACALCHLVSGFGHPQSANLAGLSEEYLYQQMLAFKNWQRIDHSGAMFMFSMPQDDEEEFRKASRYYAAIEPDTNVRVVETAQVPSTYLTPAFMRLVDNPDELQDIGQRIITLPEDVDLVLARDPVAGFVSYVPPGSLERGERIVKEGLGAIIQPCTTCHGANMEGSVLGPMIAGQFPDYLVRQLRAFKWGSRREVADPGGQMELQSRYLSEEDIIAVSAYVGSLPRVNANRDYPYVAEGAASAD